MPPECLAQAASREPDMCVCTCPSVLSTTLLERAHSSPTTPARCAAQSKLRSTAARCRCCPRAVVPSTPRRVSGVRDGRRPKSRRPRHASSPWTAAAQARPGRPSPLAPRRQRRMRRGASPTRAASSTCSTMPTGTRFAASIASGATASLPPTSLVLGPCSAVRSRASQPRPGPGGSSRGERRSTRSGLRRSPALARHTATVSSQTRSPASQRSTAAATARPRTGRRLGGSSRRQLRWRRASRAA